MEMDVSALNSAITAALEARWAPKKAAFSFPNSPHRMTRRIGKSCCYSVEGSTLTVCVFRELQVVLDNAHFGEERVPQCSWDDVPKSFSDAEVACSNKGTKGVLR